MLTESARVIRRRGNRVELELLRSSACGHCELRQGCGTGALAKLLRRRSTPLVIETQHDCEPGDEVQLMLPEQVLVSASLTVYGAPLLGLLFAGGLATSLSLPEWSIAALGITGFVVGGFLGAKRVRKLEQCGLTPYISDDKMNSAGLVQS